MNHTQSSCAISKLLGEFSYSLRQGVGELVSTVRFDISYKVSRGPTSTPEAKALNEDCASVVMPCL